MGRYSPSLNNLALPVVVPQTESSLYASIQAGTGLLVQFDMLYKANF